MERVVGKATEDECVFIPGEKLGWQMKLIPTPWQTRQAAKAVAKLECRSIFDPP
jgi:hypothetical protein